ncbi:pimeloyl-ACP methyl ester carboxylesterase [Streptococcus rupicaprae]|uniref:Pimeloyl-ACP methyl ester carboxylesterase n=1 Tax=Streptococcus rupicaprae TaxID=759619 RepID=A0ABV2FHJ4_9STRE
MIDLKKELSANAVDTPVGKLMTYFKSGQRTILFLSGIGDFSTKENFAPVLQSLPESLGILTIDYPNIGGSSIQDQSSYHFQDWIDSIIMVLNHYQVSDYILVVHSIAGLLGLKLVETVAGCKGFVGIEPTTVAILTGEIFYPEFDKVSKQVAKIGFEPYFRAISKRGMSAEYHHNLWQSFAENQLKYDKVNSRSFQFYPSLEDGDLTKLGSLPSHLPSVILSQSFREKEYLNSEYKTDHSSSQMILAGDSHYLHWTESSLIAEVIVVMHEGIE